MSLSVPENGTQPKLKKIKLRNQEVKAFMFCSCNNLFIVYIIRQIRLTVNASARQIWYAYTTTTAR